MAEDVTGASPAPTAGSLLRRAREAQGLHIAVLAANLKVPQRKLEALERDRLDELPDATFARALAQTVCRALKIDAAPVLALLPPAAGAGLEQVSAGLNTPFRDKPAAQDFAPVAVLRHPALIVVVLLFAGTAALWFWPRGAGAPAPAGPAPAASEVTALFPPAAPAEVASAADTAATAAAPASEPASAAAADAAPATAASAPSTPAPSAETAATTAAADALVQLRTTAESWIEIVDAGGRTLVSRVVAPGEPLSLDGALPLRVVIGNAAATEVTFRGQPVTLVPVGNTNVARLELK
ncbi:MAG: DUF4115 domain-containing protein [Burkholderiaceae bacterium]|nr:DUF4115 domain-containing protein [Burkholderiaceae bacterium]